MGVFNDAVTVSLGEKPAKQAWLGGEMVWSAGPGPAAWWGLRLEALEPGSAVSMVKHGSAPAVSLESSRDGVAWEQFVPGQTRLSFEKAGDGAYFRAGSGGNAAFASSDSASWSFQMSGRFKASGNIMSMLSGDGELQEFPNQSQKRQFQDMFMECSALVDVDGLELPAKTLPERCYQNLLQRTGIRRGPVLRGEKVGQASYQGTFLECQQLLEAPSLQSITRFSSSYGCFAMFRSCSALTSSPDLPPVVGSYSYWNLFEKCVKLSSAPALPATALANNCYYEMFMDCVSLSAGPYIPAQAPANGLGGMFKRCSSLGYADVALTSFGSGTVGWMQGVKANGVFRCPAALGTQDTIQRGDNYCPAGWTVENA